MKNRLLALTALSLAALPLACGPSSPDPNDPSNAPATTATALPTAEPTATATAEPKPPELSEAEKKKLEDARQLAEDRAAMEASLKAEQERLTPELRAEAKKLAGTKWASAGKALDAILKSKVRRPGNAERDAQRHPKETLDFFGLKPAMTVLEYGPGEGWYTELLAPTLAAKGKLLITMTDPNGPPDARGTFYGERTKRSLDLLPEMYEKVEKLVIDPKKLSLGLEGKLDMVLAFRTMHGMVRDGLLGSFLGEAHKALKDKGVLAVEQHRAKPDAKPEESAKQGYLPEEWLIKEIEAAGFKLAGKSEVNANPKDTKDYPEGVWALPPTFRLKDKDREKYAAIGESDRMTLKFTKVAAAKK
jgi:predicted methyltransferase